jgi:predicted nucleic acid-binding Zn ribbon protein
MAFTPIQKTLARVLKGLNIKDLESIKIFALWDRIAGEKLAAHCQPVRIDRGILYVEVDDPIWLAQVKYMKADILAKITEALQKEAIKDVRFYLRS